MGTATSVQLDSGIPERFVQDNHSRSQRGILRGLHAQSPNPQGKLVRCIEGSVWDVAVDVRLGSPAFGVHVAAELSAGNFHQLYVPPGCLHGFVVLSDAAQVEYKCTAVYDARADFGGLDGIDAAEEFAVVDDETLLDGRDGDLRSGSRGLLRSGGRGVVGREKLRGEIGGSAECEHGDGGGGELAAGTCGGCGGPDGGGDGWRGVVIG